MKETQQRGFTLIELMFALVVMGVLLGLSVPNFRDFLRNSRLTSSANDLLADLNVARTEAIKRRVTVTLCSSGNAAEAEPDCADADATDFSGWVAFVDSNSNGAFDSGEIVLRRHASVPAGVSAKSNNGFVSYASTGFLQSIAGNSSATRMAFCDGRGNKKVSGNDSAIRVVTLISTGRAGVVRDYTEVTTLLADVGGCP